MAAAQCFAVVFTMVLSPPQFQAWRGDVATLGMDGRWTMPSRIRAEEMLAVNPGADSDTTTIATANTVAVQIYFK